MFQHLVGEQRLVALLRQRLLTDSQQQKLRLQLSLLASQDFGEQQFQPAYQ
jgi:hypothetical protein